MDIKSSCYVVGETGLVISCAELLLQQDNGIIGIISKDRKVQKWAIKNEICIYESIDDIKFSEDFDYLFSIANPSILPNWLVKKAKKYAINYHDGPLPRYAGTHATSWALLNDEKKHGISWHIINEKVDVGDILQQSFFKITKSETTFSLNLKCFQAAISSFTKLLQDIKKNVIKKKKQNIDQRIFYYKHQKPIAAGIIDWQESIKEIERLYRALYFGDYKNTFATIKIIINDKIYLPKQIKIKNEKCAAPGEIIRIDENGIEVAAKDGSVLIGEFFWHDHIKKSVKSIIERHNLKQGDFLPLLSEQEQLKYSRELQASSKSDLYWLTEYFSIEDLEMPWSMTRNSQSIKYNECIVISKSLGKFSDSSQYLLALVLIYLSKLTQQEEITVSLMHDKNQSVILFNSSQLNLDIKSCFSIATATNKILEKIQFIDSKCACSKDFFYRYGLDEANISVEVAILDDNPILTLSNNKPLSIGVVDNKIYLQANLDDKKQKVFKNFIRNLNAFITDAIQNSQKKIKELELIHSEEKSWIKELNKTDTSYFDRVCVHGLFERQVEKNPDRVAIVYEDKQLTYSELNKMGNRLARYLLSLDHNNQKGVVIGILLGRSLDMVISMLGCMKAGMAYLPIDVDYPGDRIKHILTDANVLFVLTKSKYENVIPQGKKSIFIDKLKLPNQDGNLKFQNLKNLIYVLYTSGSTGLPKGSDLMHLGVSNLLTWYKKQFQINRHDNILIFTAFGFDLTQKNILGGLISGAQVKLFEDVQFDSRLLVRYIKEKKITFFNCPPSAFYSIIENGGKKEELPSLRIVLLGGEGIIVNLIKDFIYSNMQCKVVNTYGPTECSDLSLTHTLNLQEIKNNCNIPLGRNVGNVQIYILDKNLNPVPLGVIGEVYIGGIGLARGYLNRPKLTAEKFIANPFIKSHSNENGDGIGSRIYRIGDLAKYLSNGNIEYVGRVDHQVKLRGYRIELGEIENIIMGISEVSQSVILVREDELNQKRLVAYIVLEKDKQVESESESRIIKLIRNCCEDKLPEYMHPNQIMILDKMPLTPNGKIDRNKLPKPIGREGMDEYQKPKGRVEKILAKVWSKVLGIEKISRTDNFFNLGGDSIVSLRLVAFMREEGYILKIHDIFTFKTIEKIAQYTSQNLYLESNVYLPFSLIKEDTRAKIIVKNSNVEDIYPASYLQKGMIVESLRDKGTYHDIFSYIVKSPFYFHEFFDVWKSLVKKYASLRFSFIEDAQDSYLVIENKNIDLKSKIKVIERSNIQLIINDEIRSGLNFNEAGVFRLIIGKTDQNKCFTLVISFHHAIMDGWSLASLVSEFVDIYSNQGEIELSNRTISYGEFVKDEIAYSKSMDLHNSWGSAFSGYKNNFHISKNTKNIKSEAPYKLQHTLNIAESSTILKYAEREGFSVDTIFLSAYIYALSRISSSNDVVVGLVVNNRLEKIGGDKQIGLFLNTVPVRCDFDDRDGINAIELNRHINKVKNEILKIKQYPYLKLKTDFKLSDDLLDFCFNYLHFHVMSKMRNENKIDRDVFFEKTNIPCTFEIFRQLNRFDISLNINVNVYSKEIIKGIFAHIKFYLEKLIIKEYELPYILPQEHFKIIEWNRTEDKCEEVKCVHILFEELAEKNPDRIAVVYEDKQLTYGELNRRANQVGWYLRKKGVSSDDLVAVYLPKKLETIVSLLGILKSGGAYVPLDSEYPEERIEYMLKDSQAKILITSSNTNYNYQRYDGEIIFIENNNYRNENGDNLQGKVALNSLAYVIYTSGSTGKPKGVACMHYSVLNTLVSINEGFKFNQNDKILALSALSFDLSVYDIFGIFALGGVVVLPDSNKVKNVDYWCDLIGKHFITIWNTVPQLAVLLINHMEDEAVPYKLDNKIRVFLLSGDYIYPNLPIKIKKQFCNSEVISLGGATEGSIWSILYKIKNNMQESYKIPYGMPMKNQKILLLDRYREYCPIGVIGEIYIGGEGLARGYLNRAGLTAEKFVANPFRNEKELQEGRDARIYRTGDLGRYLKDGNIEFIGRNDDQVKIRGYRIELGEIENVLSKYDGVKESVVLAKDLKEKGKRDSEGRKYIVGYYVLEEGKELAEGGNEVVEEGVLEYMKDKLPEYMVPNVLMKIEKIPLTMNGKLDRKILPDPGFRGNEGNYVGARNEVENKICKVWGDLLGIDEKKVSIRDDFFRMGGDSIVSIQLVSRLRQRLGIELGIRDIFKYKSIEKIYDHVINKGKKVKRRSEQGELGGEVKLLTIQEWFFEGEYKKKNHWNQSFIVKVLRLNEERLQRSLEKLIKHHDVLRMRYREEEHKGKESDIVKYVQYYKIGESAEKIKVLDINSICEEEGSEEFNKKLDEILTGWQREFNIETGPIYSIGYLYGYKDGSARIHFALHHLIVDAVSWRILIGDLRQIYEGSELGEKGSSYRQWVEAVKKYGDNYKEEKKYWEEVLGGNEDNKERLEELIRKSEGENLENCRIELGEVETNKLLKKSNKAYNTEINDILLTALGYALREVTGSNVNHIVIEGHGREDIDESIDVTRCVGWFTTMYPVKLEVGEEMGDSIREIKEGLRKIPNKGIGYGAIKRYKREKLPKISFNYLGQFDKEGSEEGWKIVDESSGRAVDENNEDSNIININGLVIGGKLSFEIESKIGKEITEKLGIIFKEKLEEIIEYTTKQERSYLTVSDVGGIISKEYLDKIQGDRDIIGVYKANSLQEGFIHHALNQGEIDDAYRVQLIWEYNKIIEVDKLKESWRYAQKRYGALRLRFSWEEGLVQIVDKEVELDWRYIDISKERGDKQEVEIKKIQEGDRKEEYRLERGKLFRVYIIKQKEDKYICIFSNHHAIIDGWSIPLLQRYVHDTYMRLVNKEEILVSEDISYEETQRYLQVQKEDSKSYWKGYIENIEDKVDLRGLLLGDKNDVRIREYKYIKEVKEEEIKIREELYRKVKEVTREEGVTVNAVLQYVWHKVISIYGNSKQTVVGTVVSGRNIAVDNVESSVGLYINTLPLIVNHKEEIVIKEIQKIQENINEINTRSEVSLAKLQKGGERLFESLFVYENYPNPAGGKEELGMKFREVIEKLDYPLGVIAYEGENEIVFKISYAGELFAKERIKDIERLIKGLIKQIVEKPEEEIRRVNYLGEEVYKQVIKWNETEKDYGGKETLIELFEEQADKTPDRIAVIYEDKQISYRELNNKANCLGNYLRKEGNLRREERVILCLNRSEYMLIGILGVLKAGGCYVPISPSYPEERIEYVIEDADCQVILCNEEYVEKLKKMARNNIQIISVDGKGLLEKMADYKGGNLEVRTSQEDLVYIIYTSGTTGKPKGVTVKQAGVVNRIKWMNEKYPLDRNDKIMQKTPYTFDVSVWELLWANWYGGSIVFAAPEGHRDIAYIKKLSQKEQITIMHFVPTMLSVYIDGLDSNYNHNLRRIFSSGEELKISAVKDCYKNLEGIEIHNLYGPTEASIDVLYYNCVDMEISDVHIGKPIANTQAYILSGEFKLLPIGAAGEIYVGGIGLARGYLNRAGLTAEKFVANPFATEEDIKRGYSRLYKTGDIGRYLADGNIEYIGRNDEQVKIRGYRIELGEIENVLQEYKGIKQSVVLAKEREEGDKYLIGYYVSEVELDEEDLESYLGNKLPEYMLPSKLKRIEEIPLTSNGKIDKKGLPEVEFINEENYVAPRNDIEKKICEIWKEVLRIDKVGIKDDFFRLGGDSIVSIQLTSRLRQKLALNISVKDIFEYRSIERVWEEIRKRVEEFEVIREEGILKGELGLLPIQEWFFEQDYKKIGHWNQSFMIKVRELDVERLKDAIIKLVSYHDSFRLRYRRDKKGDYRQYYGDPEKIKDIEELDIRSIEGREEEKKFMIALEERFTDWQSKFDIEKGPLYKIGYIHGYEDGSARIYFALHHLLVDAVSWRIIAEDISSLYEGREVSRKGSSYRQWVEVVKGYEKDNKEESKYWEGVLEDYRGEKLIDLRDEKGRTECTEIELSKEETNKLLKKSNQVYNTEINDILLASLGCALKEITGEEVNHIVMEGHGREEIKKGIDISRCIGWFTTLYPVRLIIESDIGETIKGIKENLRHVPNKGLGYGVIRGYSREELPKINFNYLGQFNGLDGEWKIVGENSGRAVAAENDEENIININGLIIGGKLRFTISSKLERAYVNKLGSILEEKLVEIISHTESQGRSYLTESDIGNIIDREELDRLQAKRELEGVYKANSLQQGFIYHALRQGDVDDAYRVQVIWEYKKEIEIDKLKEAWECAQKKYAALRLRFDWKEELLQVIDKEISLDWRYIDISKEEGQEEKMKKIEEADRREGYRLDEGKLLRVYILKRGEQLYRCILSNHQAILDGWSGVILREYVHEVYLTKIRGEKVKIKEEKNYEETQRYLQKEGRKDEEYWYNYISKIEERGGINVLCNSQERLENYHHIKEQREREIRIEGEIYRSLKCYNQETGVTINAILQYVWHKVLGIYSGSKQTVVGTVVSGREKEISNIEEGVGLYINTLPLLVEHRVEAIETVIKRIQEDINEASRRSGISLVRLQKEGKRLFDSVFVYENYPTSGEKREELEMEVKKVIENIDYPLGIIVHEEKAKIIIKVKYAGELIESERIESIVRLIKGLLKQIVEKVKRTNKLRLLAEEEEKQIIIWNQAEKEYGDKERLIELFEAQVEKNPDRIAVVYEGRQISYRELNKRSNQLGRYLISKGIRVDDLVLVCVDRSEHLLVSMLGIIKAGGGYVPVVSSYPEERVKYILSDTKAKMIIGNEEYSERLEKITKEASIERELLIELIDSEELAEKISKEEESNPEIKVRRDNIAYVIYTSGTTGKPKGVMVNHGGMMNHLMEKVRDLKYRNKDIIAQTATQVFDISIWQLLIAIIKGSKEVIIKQESVLDVNKLMEILRKERVSILELVPTQIEYLLEKYRSSSIRILLVTGEAFKKTLREEILRKLRGIEIINAYGPTECSDDVTHYIFNERSKRIKNNITPIGKTIANIQIYILDKQMSMLPIGAVGEIYVGGGGLARGYINRAGLTAEKFVANPYAREEDIKRGYSRLYKTGDIGRYLADGNIEYIGRNDEQVKIRGYRIELGEIENVLQGYKGIKQSVVLAKEREEGDKYLVGYYVSEEEIDEEDIESYLGNKLPEYMLPSKLKRIEEIPLTSNGKIDKKGLPEVEFRNEENYVEARNELERKMCEIWEEVLGIDKVGIKDDFFRLGGHSLLAIRLINRINSEYNKKINIGAIFEYKKINSFSIFLSNQIDRNDKGQIFKFKK